MFLNSCQSKNKSRMKSQVLTYSLTALIPDFLFFPHYSLGIPTFTAFLEEAKLPYILFSD